MFNFKIFGAKIVKKNMLTNSTIAENFYCSNLRTMYSMPNKYPVSISLSNIGGIFWEKI